MFDSSINILLQQLYPHHAQATNQVEAAVTDLQSNKISFVEEYNRIAWCILSMPLSQYKNSEKIEFKGALACMPPYPTLSVHKNIHNNGEGKT